MSELSLFITAQIRFISYVIVIVVSVFSLLKHRQPKIIYIGDLLLCALSIVSLITQTWFHVEIGFASVWIFTPAFFIWALSRVINFNKFNEK